MVQKVIVLLCTLALVSAGTIGTDYSPATSVSSVDSSTNNEDIAAKAGTRLQEKPIYPTPAPIYESASTHESHAQDLDGSDHPRYAKSLDTAYSSVKSYDSHIKNNRILTHSVPTVYSAPIHNSYAYSPGAYTVTSPLSNSIVANSISPFTYTHSTPIVAKYSSPIVTKTIAPVTAYATHGGQSVKTTVTYSEAPLVSHMTFTGLGTSYAW